MRIRGFTIAVAAMMLLIGHVANAAVGDTATKKEQVASLLASIDSSLKQSKAVKPRVATKQVEQQSQALVNHSLHDRDDAAAMKAEELKTQAEEEAQAINASLRAAPSTAMKQTLSEDGKNLWVTMVDHFQLGDQAKRPEVRQQLLWYLSRKKLLNRMLKNAVPYLHYVYAETAERNMPAEFALLPMVESAYNPFAYSKAGATGLWQMMPGTASSFGLNISWWYDGRRDILVSTQSALNYLSQLHDTFRDWYLTAAAYNVGIGAVQAAQQYNQREEREADFWSLPLPNETKDYVPRLLALAEIIKHPDYYGITLPRIVNQATFLKVDLNSQIDLLEAAHLAGTTPDVIRRLNPGMRRWATNPNGRYTLLIPSEKAAVFNKNIQRVAGKEHVSWQYHEVRRGETLQSIAKIYHTRLPLLKKVNGLKNNSVRTAQGLLVPLYLHRTYSMPINKVERLAPVTVEAENTPPKTVANSSLRQLVNSVYGG